MSTTTKIDAARESARRGGTRLTGPTLVASLRRVTRETNRSGLVSLFAAFFGAIVAFGLIVWAMERTDPAGGISTPIDGLWWAVVTLATVGYGDTYPASALGKAAAMAFMIGGFVLSAIVSGTVASIFVERRIREGKGLQDIRLKGHFVVCGWNVHADAVLDGLEAESRGAPIVLINGLEPERFDAIRSAHPDVDLRFVRGDHTLESVLRKASVQQCRSCILLPDESGGSGEANADERTRLAALAVKSIARDVAVRAAILKAESEQHLRRAEVDDVVLHGEFTGFLSDSSGAIDDFIKRKFAEAAIDLGSGDKPEGKARLAPGPDYVIGGTDVAFVVGGSVTHG